MKIEVKHHLDITYPGGISKTEKVWKLFGVVLKRKTFHYPRLEKYDVVTDF